jgi:hypothetical protein
MPERFYRASIFYDWQIAPIGSIGFPPKARGNDVVMCFRIKLVPAPFVVVFASRLETDYNL